MLTRCAPTRSLSFRDLRYTRLRHPPTSFTPVPRGSMRRSQTLNGWAPATPVPAYQLQRLVTRQLVRDVPKKYTSACPDRLTDDPPQPTSFTLRELWCAVLSGMCAPKKTLGHYGPRAGPTENNGCAQVEVHFEYGSPCVRQSPAAHLCRIDPIPCWMLLLLVVTYIYPPSPATLSFSPF